MRIVPIRATLLDQTPRIIKSAIAISKVGRNVPRIFAIETGSNL
jgi:hypothetical protein